MKQSDIIKQLSDRELTQQLMFSQIMMAVVGFLLSIFLFENLAEWLNYFSFHMHDLVLYGVLPGMFIVLIDLLIMKVFPEKYYDDGGINARIFRNRTVAGIFGIALLAAVTEELLFRGVIQTVFGYIIASVLFALVHIRYLNKPVLLVSVILISFYIGYIFVLTENLLVTITAHFTVDFVLGLIIRYKK